MPLSKSQILGLNDIKTKEVEVPEWSGSVFVRMLSGFDRDAIGEALDDNGRDKHFTTRFVSLVLCDESGEPMFKDEADVKALGKKSNAALLRVFNAGWKLNRLDPESVGELGFDSPAAQKDDSSSS